MRWKRHDWGQTMTAMPATKISANTHDASHVMRLYDFICGELLIPSKDVAMRVQVALSVSAAYYTLRDDNEIIHPVMGALAA
jgi:hypothetical protein